MLIPVRSTKFKKDYKKIERQGKDVKKLKRIMVLKSFLREQGRTLNCLGSYVFYR